LRLFAVALTVLVTAACGEKPAPAPSPTTAASLPPGHPPLSAGTAAEGEAIEGEIRLDPRIRDKARPEDVLYVIARNSATRQVVAVRKEERVRFPFAFRLSAGDAMMEGVPFAGPCDVTARLSRSGDAVPQAGDLEGTVKNVDAGSRGVRVVVDTERQ